MQTDIQEQLSVETIAFTLTALNIQYVIIANIDGEIISSDPNAEFLIPLIVNSPEWKDHEAVIIKIDSETNCLFIISIHSTKRGRPEGGARWMCYESFKKAMDDCLRLSYGMTMKNATGDIWEGGAKSIIIPYSRGVFDVLMEQKAETKEKIGSTRKQLWKNFGEFVSYLRGLYLVGEDVNLNSADMATILQHCVHTSCLDKKHGGSGNPSPFTATGVFQAIRAAVETIFPENPGLSEKKILVKGLGNVGYALVRMLVKAGAKVITYDPINIDAKVKLKSEFPGDHIKMMEDFDEFISTSAHVFSPNANSLSINKRDIRKFKVRIICGAENGQLEDIQLAEYLHKKGIIYIPETWINYMGVYSAYQEHRGILEEEFEQKIWNIYKETKAMLKLTKAYSLMPYKYAIVVAQVKAQQLNPIDGHRGIKIIKELFIDWQRQINIVN